MTEPTDALLPCPFCGEAAKHSFNSLYGDMSMASCKSCGATAYAPKWNRRAVLAKWGQPAQAQAGAVPLTDEQIKALMQAHRTAMLMTCKAKVPECGEFAAIAQDLDWLCESFGIKGGQHVS